MPHEINFSDHYGVRVQQANIEIDESAKQVSPTAEELDALNANLLDVNASQDEVQVQAANKDDVKKEKEGEEEKKSLTTDDKAPKDEQKAETKKQEETKKEEQKKEEEKKEESKK